MELFLLPIVLWVLFSMFVADLGKSRNIGYTSALILSLLISPIIGLIIVLLSPKTYQVEVVNTPTVKIQKTDNLKTCPDCAEEVKAAAKKCKHCGYRWSA